MRNCGAFQWPHAAAGVSIPPHGAAALPDLRLGAKIPGAERDPGTPPRHGGCEAQIDKIEILKDLEKILKVPDFGYLANDV